MPESGLSTLIASLPGVVLPYAGSTAPSGFLFCYGQALSRTTYKRLFDVIGTQFGAGDGSTTFNVPDLRGRTVAASDNMGGTAAQRGQVVTNLTTAAGSASATAASGTGLAIGMYIVSSNVPAGTKITAVSGTGITMSANASAAGTVSTRFSFVTDAQALGGNGGAIQHKLAATEIAAHTHTVPGQNANGGSYSALQTVGDSNLPSNWGTSANVGDLPHANMQPTIVLNYIIKT